MINWLRKQSAKNIVEFPKNSVKSLCQIVTKNAVKSLAVRRAPLFPSFGRRQRIGSLALLDRAGSPKSGKAELPSSAFDPSPALEPQILSHLVMRYRALFGISATRKSCELEDRRPLPLVCYAASSLTGNWLGRSSAPTFDSTKRSFIWSDVALHCLWLHHSFTKPSMSQKVQSAFLDVR